MAAQLSFSVLPYEIVSMIPEDFTYQDIVNLCKTEKSLNRLCQDDNFWSLLLQDRHPHYLRRADLTAREMFRHAETMYLVYLYQNNQLIYSDVSADDDNIIAAILAEDILSYTSRSSSTGGPQYRLLAYYPGGQQLQPHQINALLTLHRVSGRGLKPAQQLVNKGNDVYTFQMTRPDDVTTVRRVMNVSPETLQTMTLILTTALGPVQVRQVNAT